MRNCLELFLEMYDFSSLNQEMSALSPVRSTHVLFEHLVFEPLLGHPWRCSFGCLWLRKLAKTMVKTLERQNDIFGTYIYENNGN